MTKLAALLDQVDAGSVLLPEFQRGYVWNRDQVRGLMRSLYRGYPVGSLLTWETRGDLLILDGQQRLTTLYGISRGRPPAFFRGDQRAFTGLRFNVEDETFEFHAPARADPPWVDVTALYTEGLEPLVAALHAHPGSRPRIAAYLTRLARLQQVLERDIHEEKVTGADKTTDVVVDIFNRVNAGGTRLSAADLALAKQCAHWPQARAVMRDHLDRWDKEGFSFTLDWLLRNVTAVATGRAEFSSLDAVPVTAFQQALEAAAGYISYFLDLVVTRLGLDHDRVLAGRYAFPVVCLLLDQRGGSLASDPDVGRVLYWYVHAALRGRFAGSAETALNQDYGTVTSHGADGLVSSLERWRGGNLAVTAADFDGSGRGSRCYPLLYLLTRVHGAHDFGSGLPLADPQLHHVFPKAGNAVANLCFLSQETRMVIGQRPPGEYFRVVESMHPGVLASQWIPHDPALWQDDRYPDFLAARRELLAAAANDFLSGLLAGTAPAPGSGRLLIAADAGSTPVTALVTALVAELTELGCAEPALDCEVPDPATGEVLLMADACWPEGLQPGQGAPVVLALDAAAGDLDRLRELGYDLFTSVDSLRGHVRRRNSAAAGVSA